MSSISILGCGWLGMPLGEALVQEGHQVKGSTRSAEKLREIESKEMEPFVVDLKAVNLPHEFFDSEIIVLNVPPSNASSEDDYLNQLDRFLQEISSETHVIFISSTGVYPNLNRVVTEQDADPDATSRSGISLLRAEQKFHASNNTVVRFGGLIDERRHPGRWFAGKQNLSGGDIPVNMIRLEDCIGAINSILEKECWGQIFNVCHPDHPPKREYYARMSVNLGLASPQFILTDKSDWKVVSSDHFTTETGYEFDYPIVF